MFRSWGDELELTIFYLLGKEEDLVQPPETHGLAIVGIIPE